MYHVRVLAKNEVTPLALEASANVIITSAPCAPPQVTIMDNSTNNRDPVVFMRSETITIKTRAILNCAPILNTRYYYFFINWPT